MELNLLKDVVIIFTLSVFVIYLFSKIKVPAIVGFLLTGVLAGPHALQLISNPHDIEIIAEIGVILLLFTIGIEFSLKKLKRIQRYVILGGGLQVGITVLITYLLVSAFGFSWQQAVFAGFLVSLSSTAVVLKMIQSSGEIGTQHGQTSLAILIFQDIIIVPMMLILPFIAGNEANLSASLLLFVGKAVLIIGFTYVGAKYLMPWALYHIAKTQSKELFMIAIMVVGLAVAWLTSELGLSLALGAFIAGLIISESEYSEQAFGNIVPFRDVFTSFFFVSIGMLLNVTYVADHLVFVLILTVAILLLKTMVAGFSAFALGFPFKTTVIVALTLSQIGEFSFILSKIGMDYELFSQDYYQAFLAVSVITMAVTPFIIRFAPVLADFILQFPLPKLVRHGLRDIPEPEHAVMTNHMVIVGYGINGRNVAQAAKFADIPHVILELNPDTVKDEQSKGEIIYYGDATQETVLRHASIEKATVLVVTLPHTGDVKRITDTARSLNPDLHIIIRTRFVKDMKVFYDLGADEVIPEEFETSVEIFSRVLAKYLIPRNEIEKMVAKVRADSYEMFRSLNLPSKELSFLKVQAPEVEIHSLHVCNNAPVIGRPLQEMDFIHDSKLSLLALSRSGNVIPHPGKETLIQKNDIFFFLGKRDHIDTHMHLFKSSDEECETDPTIG
ncbi:MAG TPA: cation:proton antiporter [Bacteroidales bacterium]|nr:cation:proton antiporter [Bacteroidales bacterium]